MTVKLGFSVVAPMRVMMPFSTHGRRTSCCDFDQRWISSRNSIVCRQSVKFFCALAMIRTTSSFFDRTPDRWKNSASREFAMTRARLVFPHPGGHQKSIDGMRPAWINVYIGLPLAMRCACPTRSSSFSGRRRDASGVIDVEKSDCIIIKIISYTPIIVSSIAHSSSLTGVIESLLPRSSIRIVSRPGISRIIWSVRGRANVATYPTSTQYHIGFSGVDRGS